VTDEHLNHWLPEVQQVLDELRELRRPAERDGLLRVTWPWTETGREVFIFAPALEALEQWLSERDYAVDPYGEMLVRLASRPDGKPPIEPEPDAFARIVQWDRHLAIVPTGELAEEPPAPFNRLLDDMGFHEEVRAAAAARISAFHAAQRKRHDPDPSEVSLLARLEHELQEVQRLRPLVAPCPAKIITSWGRGSPGNICVRYRDQARFRAWLKRFGYATEGKNQVSHSLLSDGRPYERHELWIVKESSRSARTDAADAGPTPEELQLALEKSGSHFTLDSLREFAVTLSRAPSRVADLGDPDEDWILTPICSELFEELADKMGFRAEMRERVCKLSAAHQAEIRELQRVESERRASERAAKEATEEATRKKQEAQTRGWRRASKQCENCGRELSLLHRALRRPNHPDCTTYRGD